MGKIRVKTIGDESAEEEAKKKAEEKREQKKAREAKEEAVEAPESTPSEKQAEKKVEAEPATQSPKAQKKESKYAKKNKAAPRSLKYQEVSLLVDKNKFYDLSEALELLNKTHLTDFDETVELHINTTGRGISGGLSLPHGSGKKTRVAVADDALIAEVEKGKVEFDVLVASPAMMPKLARVAKVLGPRGLMPNPKNGTITDSPDELIKKYEGGHMTFKTEANAPLIHLVVGKLSFGEKKLMENIQAAINAIKKDKITKVTLKSTMSPGIKLAGTSF